MSLFSRKNRFAVGFLERFGTLFVLSGLGLGGRSRSNRESLVEKGILLTVDKCFDRPFQDLSEVGGVLGIEVA